MPGPATVGFSIPDRSRRARWTSGSSAAVARTLLSPRAFALLETTGRRTGLARRTPVGNGLDPAGEVFWLVAVPLPDDDPVARSRAHPHPWDAALGRMIATTPLTVRIDLDPS